MNASFFLTGVGFLLVYSVIGIVINWGLRAWFRYEETPRRWQKPQLTDPYQIAYLRGGKKEALRIATISLIDRQLLSAVDNILQTQHDLAADVVNRPIEKAILNRYRTSGNAEAIFTDPSAIEACKEYREILAAQGLMADHEVYKQRFFALAIAESILIIITAVRMVNALANGQYNVLFLILLTMVFSFAAFVAYRKPITAKGNILLADLRELFSRLRGKVNTIRAGGQTNEAALLAAVFGINILPITTFPFIKKLYPQPDQSCGSTSSSSNSCGGSSGSSSGCGGGGGCGGCGG